MNEINKILDCCVELRKDILNGSLRFEGSDCFPIGCCGNASDILKARLTNIGFKDVQYKSGWNEGKSHGWLEYRDLIIDVTYDQFPQFSSDRFMIIKKNDSDFHKKYLECNI